MAHYLITGSATGIGAAIKARLLAENHQVSTIDIRDADFLITYRMPLCVKLGLRN